MAYNNERTILGEEAAKLKKREIIAQITVHKPQDTGDNREYSCEVKEYEGNTEAMQEILKMLCHDYGMLCIKVPPDIINEGVTAEDIDNAN